MFGKQYKKLSEQEKNELFMSLIDIHHKLALKILDEIEASINDFKIVEKKRKGSCDLGGLELLLNYDKVSPIYYRNLIPNLYLSKEEESLNSKIFQTSYINDKSLEVKNKIKEVWEIYSLHEDYPLDNMMSGINYLCLSVENILMKSPKFINILKKAYFSLGKERVNLSYFFRNCFKNGFGNHFTLDEQRQIYLDFAKIYPYINCNAGIYAARKELTPFREEILKLKGISITKDLEKMMFQLETRKMFKDKVEERLSEYYNENCHGKYFVQNSKDLLFQSLGFEDFKNRLILNQNSNIKLEDKDDIIKWLNLVISPYVPNYTIANVTNIDDVKVKVSPQENEFDKVFMLKLSHNRKKFWREKPISKGEGEFRAFFETQNNGFQIHFAMLSKNMLKIAIEDKTQDKALVKSNIFIEELMSALNDVNSETFIGNVEFEVSNKIKQAIAAAKLKKSLTTGVSQTKLKI